MNIVKVLIEGYAIPGPDESFVASSSCSLIITDDNKKILVDPWANKEKLLNALKGNNLQISGIDILYLTHYHPDHFLNLKLFCDHDLYDGTMLWKNDAEITYDKFANLKNGEKVALIHGTKIKIIPTPGHAPEHTSLLVENTDKGTICVAQDVFWWEDGKQKSDTVDDLLSLEDPFATDLDALRKSRLLVLELADWIIPGHGKMFKNPKMAN